MLKRIFERGHRTGSAYALTTFARCSTGRRRTVEAYLEALPTGADSPFARIGTLHIARVQLFRALVHQGPKQCKTDTLSTRTSSSRARSTATWTRIWSAAPARARVRRVVGPLRRLPGPRGRARVPGWVRSIQARPGLFRTRDAGRDRAEVHEALALREQVIDFAVDAQGVDAATLQAALPGDVLHARPPAQRAAPQAAAARLRPRGHPGQRPARLHASRPRRTCSCGSWTSRRRAR